MADGTIIRQKRNRCRLRLEALEDKLAPVTWPVTAPAGLDVHQMYNGFGAGRPPGDPLGFHEGIDIWVDGEGGANQKVVAARAGEIVRLAAVFAQGGRIAIKVNIGGGSFEYDDYLHIDPKAGLVLNQQVAEGAEIGSISTVLPAGRRHLHLSVLSQSLSKKL
jgi:murein DD-endopeptidase MepM/ murein hydrolase activator NlpD